MTNHWIDIKNAKRILVCGSNAAENHPVAMTWINEARTNGAKLLVADPRKTRLAGMADRFIRIRPGTNGAFMMGLINYAIKNNRYPDALGPGNEYHTKTTNRSFWADDNSMQENVTGWPMWSDATFKLNTDRTDYMRETVTGTISGKPISNLPVRSTLSDPLSDPDSVWSVLKQRASYYTSDVVADICDIPGGAAAFEAFANEYCVPYSATNKAGTILYAMGGTQHTHGSQDLRAYCMLQLVLGNMGRVGGGVNALRGIHNVQGSTDQGVLFNLIPGYSLVPSNTAPTGYAAYMNTLFGNPKRPSAPYWNGLQQVGFRNMLWHYFRQGDRSLNPPATGSDEYTTASTADSNLNYDKFPKGNGYNHVTMFQNMQGGTPTVKMLVSWGQNPAVTEPNLTEIKEGLQNLDALVVVDMFESETAGCDRKAGGVTWFLPACSFVEEAGSVTNSGRWIQWRYQAIPPQGGTKTDTEILLRLAKALDDKGAFSHIGASPGQYAPLYGDASQYGWTPGSAFDSETVARLLFRQMASKRTATHEYGALWIYGNAAGGAYDPSVTGGLTGQNDWWTPTDDPGNLAKSRNTYPNLAGKDQTIGLYPRWSYAWLINRRVFYNQNLKIPDQVSGDNADLFVASDEVARLFVHNPSAPAYPNGVGGAAGYAVFYRAYNTLTEKNAGDGSTTGGATTAASGAVMPKHWEPRETKRLDLVTKYGQTGIDPTGPYATVQTTLTSNPIIGSTSITVGSVAGLAVGDILTLDPGGLNQENIKIGAIDTGTKTITLDAVYSPTGLTKDHAPGELVRKDLTASYPLTLTTFRVTEHFQGGPLTRNVPWLCELVPEAIIEINSADAYARGINAGDSVYIDTIRANNIGPFKAVVGTGPQENQRVAAGYVAVPWHWGNKGLKTGPSANNATIDAMDIGAAMPEFKACICNIHK